MHFFKKQSLASTYVILLSCAPLADQVQAQSRLELRTAPVRGAPDFDDTVDRFLNRKAPKIVNGTPAAEGAYPWQVSLTVSWIADPCKTHLCGGCIITNAGFANGSPLLGEVKPEGTVVVSGTNALKHGVTRTNA